MRLVYIKHTQKIGIIGSGVAGLAAAWILGEDHEVTLFERKTALGLGHLGHKVAKEDGGHRIDIPPRVINATHYQHLFELIGEAGIATYKIKQQPSFSYLNGKTYVAFKTYNLFGKSISLPKFFGPSSGWLLKHGSELSRWFSFIRSISTAELTLEVQTSGATALDEFLLSRNYSSDFIYGFLFPMWSLMCTCDYPNVNRFPIVSIIELFRNFTGDAATRRIKGGSEALESKVIARVKQSHLNVNVESLAMNSEKNSVIVRSDTTEQEFDHVIIATEPPYAAKLAANIFPTESELIEQIPTYETHMVMHTDKALMPSQLSAWAPVNMFWDRQQNKSTATLWMNQLESHQDLREPLFQSWDPLIQPDETKVLARRSFKRSLASISSQEATTQLRLRMSSIKDRRVWFAGSYVTAGIPLLENGVHSAKLVCELIQQSLDT